jgi:hypothetical protein
MTATSQSGWMKQASSTGFSTDRSSLWLKGAHKVDTSLVTSSQFTQALAKADDEPTEKYPTKAQEMTPEATCDYVRTLLAQVSTARD